MLDSYRIKPENLLMLPDYHIHTYLCKHAEGEVHEYYEAAIKQGITEMCFTDHAPSPNGYDSTNRMTIDQFPTYKDLIHNLRDMFDTNILYGIEADYYEGCESFLKDWLIEQDFDLVLGSVHYIRKWAFDNPDNVDAWQSVDVTEAYRDYFEHVIHMAKSGMYDIASHLDIPKKFGFRPKDKDLEEMVKPVLDVIAEAGMGMEINTSGLRRTANEIYPSPLILSLACEREIPICFGSDSHTPSDVGADFDAALKYAKDAGYTTYFKIKRREKTIHPLPTD